mmetsp:Transcript_10183/g.39632  ORF Transcript_10183/g.39632 Transcript_10183/m.39632 type:complete len:237 (+) Transcript_10183:1835-2545(+)
MLAVMGLCCALSERCAAAARCWPLWLARIRIQTPRQHAHTKAQPLATHMQQRRGRGGWPTLPPPLSPGLEAGTRPALATRWAGFASDPALRCPHRPATGRCTPLWCRGAQPSSEGGPMCRGRQTGRSQPPPLPPAGARRSRPGRRSGPSCRHQRGAQAGRTSARPPAARCCWHGGRSPWRRAPRPGQVAPAGASRPAASLPRPPRRWRRASWPRWSSASATPSRRRQGRTGRWPAR